MDNLFIKYMSDRAKKPVLNDGNVENPGPVITISRQYGCPGERIAAKLAQALSAVVQGNENPLEWRWISKEILEDSAKQLKLAPSLANDIKEYRLHSFMDHLTLFFSNDFYPSDTKVMSTIAKVIHAAASQGHVVILGRAAESITQTIPKSLHFKLEAPLDWRAKEVSKSHAVAYNEAKTDCIEEDKRRAEFRDYFESGKPDIDFFDATFNTKTLNDEEIISMILKLAKKKGLM